MNLSLVKWYVGSCYQVQILLRKLKDKALSAKYGTLARTQTLKKGVRILDILHIRCES